MGSPVLDGLRVLVVDDNDDTRELWELVLSSDGAHVASAPSCERALDLFGAQDFDFLLCDLSMPGMDGFDCIRAIRAFPPPKGKIPALAASGNTLYQDVQEAKRAGFDDFVAKPVLPGELVARIAKLRR